MTVPEGDLHWQLSLVSFSDIGLLLGDGLLWDFWQRTAPKFDDFDPIRSRTAMVNGRASSTFPRRIGPDEFVPTDHPGDCFGVQIQVRSDRSEPALVGLGVNARLIAPGSATNSIVVNRANRRDTNGMPPLGSTRVDTAGVSLLTSWINSLSGC